MFSDNGVDLALIETKQLALINNKKKAFPLLSMTLPFFITFIAGYWIYTQRFLDIISF